MLPSLFLSPFVCYICALMVHSLLSEIHDKSKQWTICALVSQMWHYRGGTDEGPIIHTDLVLLDRQGTHMYGQIPLQPAERLKDVLKEGKVYIIKKFLCNPSKTAFRPVESPYMVQFTRYSAVEEQPGMEEAFPFCTYSLTPFADIPKPASPPARFIDVIGQVTMVLDVVPVQSMCQTVPSNTRSVVLTDLLGQEMRIVLWGAHAVEFDAEAVRTMGAKEPVIAIFVGTLPKMAHGVQSLSGSSACRWYIDEDIPDINSFRASLLPSTPMFPQALPLSRLVCSQIELRQLFLTSTNLTHLRIWTNGSSVLLLSTGLALISAGDLMYCVSVYASDGTDEVEFVLFDKVATGAIGKPLITLMHQRYPCHRTIQDIAHVARFDMTTPPEIARLVGQKYAVLVAISKKSFSATSTKISFQINKIVETFNPELLAYVFPDVPGSSGTAASIGGLDMSLSPLGVSMGLMPSTPLPLSSQFRQPFPAGLPSPVLQPHMPVSYANKARATAQGTSSSAPMRGTRRSLFIRAPKDMDDLQPQAGPSVEKPVAGKQSAAT